MEMVCNAERAGLTSEDERAREGEDGEEEDDEEAEVKMTALMMDGSTGIPARYMAMTQGERAAPAALERRFLSSEGTRTPMASEPST